MYRKICNCHKVVFYSSRQNYSEEIFKEKHLNLNQL